MQSKARPPSISDQISILLETLELSSDEVSLRAALHRFSRAAGFDRYLYMSVGAEGARGITDAAANWYERYIGEEFHNVDPVMVQARRASGPFLWSYSAIETPSTRASMFKSAALEAGIVSGITVPVRVGFGKTAMLVFTSSEDVTAKYRASSFQSAVAAVAYTHLHFANLEMSIEASLDDHLSARELTCLVWTSLGKTKTEIAQMHGLAEKTVRFYLDRAREKLDAKNAPHMVRRAIERGLIPRR